nr:unnamed protein product [Digitaria exilis]
MDATAGFGSGRRPQRRIITSYHHHSRHTDAQLGKARRASGPHPASHSAVGAHPAARSAFASSPETTTCARRTARRTRLEAEAAAATPGAPRPRRPTRTWFAGTWNATAAHAAAASGRVDAERVDEGEGEEVREGEENVLLRQGRDLAVLAEEDEDLGHVEPEHGERQRAAEEEEDGAVEGEAEEARLVGAERLGAEWVHAEGEAREHGVAGDVGEGDGEGPGGEREVADGAEEEHRQGQEQSRHRDREREPAQLDGLPEGLAGDQQGHGGRGLELAPAFVGGGVDVSEVGYRDVDMVADLTGDLKRHRRR